MPMLPTQWHWHFYTSIYSSPTSLKNFKHMLWVCTLQLKWNSHVSLLLLLLLLLLYLDLNYNNNRKPSLPAQNSSDIKWRQNVDNKTIISPATSYSCQMASLALTEEQKQKVPMDYQLFVIDNRVLSTILERQRDEVTGNWRTLHNAELYDLYSLPNIILLIKLVGHVTRTRERIGTYRILLGKPEGKRPLWRTRCKWEEHIKTDIQTVGWRTYWINWLRIKRRGGVLWMR